MKRVLVTGATGFIGRHCLAPLRALGYEVHAASSAASTRPLDDVQWHRADLLDPAQVVTLMADVRPTHLLHLAWYAVPGKFWASPDNLRWVQASLGLVQEFARHGGQRIVTAGTCAEYDWRFGFCSEAVTPCAPTTLYGTCKHALRLTLEAFVAQADLSAAWGRVFFLYGPHEAPERLVPSIICSLLQEVPARCSHGEQIRDFLHVQDVADAFVALLESDVRGPVNIASGLPITLKDVIFKIADLLDRHDLVQLGALPVPPDDPPLLTADVRRLTTEVDWHTQFPLELGLEETIRWWKGAIHS